ncbi:MAG: LPXTG cell wall anchor domain-containing protein [Clostridiales bacterium]|nr:LPXTG cell wall anchor domain-containing protein [Clostridiales bacterium]
MSKANNGSKLYVPDNSDLSFWTFHFIDTDNYYLTTVVDGSTKYLRLGSDGATLVSVPDNNCKIRVVPGTGSNAGKIYLRSGNYTLAYSGNIDEGFKIGGTAGNEWLNLVEESELDNTYFMTYSARKVSVSDEKNITNGSRIIVYTRVWNETTLKYEFYAIGHDGSLVRCYESGDSIEWVGGRLNSMLWNFIEYYWEGKNDPNYYYDLYNQYSDKFIAPQASDGQIISDDRIGINLNGRRNGLYYSPIVAWDDAYYAYAGLKADTATGKIVSCSLSEADDFYFAIVHDIPVDDELTIIPTIDHTQYGITMKMVNFGTDIFTGNDNANVQSKMSAFLGSANSTQGYNAESGLLNTALVGGYPVVSSNGNSLSTWFSNAQEVNHLFIASTYSGTGYFEYDSVQNFAHLNQDTNNFVVYKELGSDNTGGPTHTHGLFFPYNDITAGVFSPNKNTTAISSAALPESDPRKYETMYLVQKSNTNYAPDYYFGMELTATFTQTPNGLDDWGHDIIYEFTGDDDFWLFVDGELIIDLGGIHSAISGDVNYRTGVVHVNGTSTTLRSLFESNYRGRNPELSDADVAAYLNEIFDGEIFKDYTTHTMSIYYLEHGAGSSNLHMRFNLASIKPGTAQLTKKLSGVDTTETVLAEFPYQIIYRTKNGDADPVSHYLTNSVADDPDRIFNYVFYKDSTVPCTYKTSISIAEKTYNDVFILKPDETVDINFPTETFPEGTELLDYRIIECGVNTDVYEAVRVNDKVITGTTVYDDNNTPVEDRKDYDIEYATTNDRARVVYENEVALDAITNLYIKKRLYDVTGEHEISASQDDTTFDFRLYLATDTGDIDNSPANMHTYHVLDADGNYCYWSVADQRLKRIEPGIGDFSALTEAQKTSATFNTSMNGSISRIPVGYTIEVRDLLVGTKFKVVERPSEIPDGYSFLKYGYSEKEYTDTEAGVSDVVVSQIKPHVEVHNIKGFGLRVNKTWTDADFMSGRDPVYFGIFYQDGNEWKVVPDSLRQMAYGTTTVYWYYDRLPVEGLADFSKYVIYEVKLTQPVVDDDGNVVSYTNLDRLDNGGSVTLSGTQIGDTEPSDFTYTVEYERGELNTNSNVRVDEVTNSRPGIIIKKTEWDGTTALQGAVFTMKDEDNNLIGTYTSDEDGLIVEAFLRENVKYYLTETSAPQGWQGLLSDMTIKLNGEIIVIGGVDDDYYMVSTDATTDTKIITVKNRPYEFKVVKMDKGTGKPLQGVKFALYREIVVDSVHSWDPNPYPGYESLTSGNDGIVISRALPAGKYQLRETKALSGYQTLSGYITFTISSTGVIELDSNTPEEATLTYDTDENGSVLYQITITNTKEFKVSIWKTNEGSETITSGASFKLYKAEDYNDTTSTIKDGAIPLVSGTTGENGILALGTLTVGEYRLIETAAPAGYNMAESAIRISVINNGVTALQEGNLSDVYKKGDQYWVVGQDNATWQIRVWNNPGVELPHTGGIGTTIFRMAGLTLILTVGIVLIFKKRH